MLSWNLNVGISKWIQFVYILLIINLLKSSIHSKIHMEFMLVGEHTIVHSNSRIWIMDGMRMDGMYGRSVIWLIFLLYILWSEIVNQLICYSSFKTRIIIFIDSSNGDCHINIENWICIKWFRRCAIHFIHITCWHTRRCTRLCKSLRCVWWVET